MKSFLSPARRQSAVLLALLLIVIVASRAFRLDVDILDVQTDEAWSVWQTYGSLPEIVRWTPYDWTPLYYVTLGAWRELAGAHPIILRWLSVLLFAVGCSALYRVGRRLYGDGVIPMLTYAALGYSVFLSTEMRGYALLLALYPLALWLTLRYFDAPTLRRALPLSVVLAAMFYTSLTAAPAIGMLVVFTLIVYGARVWRWIVPGVITILLALPEIINKAGIAVGRVQTTAQIDMPPFVDAVIAVYRAHTGDPFWAWVALVIGAAGVLALTRGRLARLALALAVWLLMPAALYVSNGLIGFFNQRYAWWVMIGAALFIGAGASRLPRAARLIPAALLLIFAFLPLPLPDYQLGEPSLAVSFEWLTDNARPGDVVLIDPNCACTSAERLGYLTRVYFPHGLTYVSDVTDRRRVWYVTGAAGATEAVAEQVSRGRVPGIFVGPPESLFRLYEAPPDARGDLYANGIRFHGAEIVGANGLHSFHEGESFTLRLWWTADRPPQQDYSVGVFIINAAGDVVLQSDSAPQTTPPETSRWQPDTIYSEDRAFTLPFPMARGSYRVMLALYWFGDEARVTAPRVGEDGLRHLTDLHIASW